MIRLRSFSSIRLAVGALVVLAAGAIYVASLPESDAVNVPMVCTFYTNGNNGAAVGARGTDCCGQVVNWGVKSAHTRCRPAMCTDHVCDAPLAADLPE